MRTALYTGAVASLALSQTTLAGFNANSKNNVVVYWGQNSYGQGSGELAQQRLSYYCNDPNIDVILLSFLIQITGMADQPELNFANQGDRCSTFPGTNTFYCPELAADIPACQANGKTIMLSIGGATYTEGGFDSATSAAAGAELLWRTFGPRQQGSSALRPFGDAAIDGFDFDYEAAVRNMIPFGNRLRELMDADGRGASRFLSAAPQCPYPDYANHETLDGQVAFDFLNVQFYNNYCGLQSYVAGAADQWNFNFATWDKWSRETSKKRGAKVLLGMPAGRTGAGSGYLDGDRLRAVVDYCRSFDSFGGAMMWDVSQAYGNSGFLPAVKRMVSGTAQKVMKAVTWEA